MIKKDDKKDDKKVKGPFKVDSSNINQVIEALHKVEARLVQREKNPKFRYRYHPNKWSDWKSQHKTAEQEISATLTK